MAFNSASYVELRSAERIWNSAAIVRHSDWKVPQQILDVEKAGGEGGSAKMNLRRRTNYAGKDGIMVAPIIYVEGLPCTVFYYRGRCDC